jgi:hypothetical protein
MWSRENSQEVGLEAAILERVRNSSLVEGLRADNVAGLKYTAEAVDVSDLFGGRTHGRRAFCTERSGTETFRGLCRSENPGMSTR